MPDTIQRSPQMDKRLLEYAMACYHTGRGWWTENLIGTGGTRRGLFETFRKRYAARRSVACLDSDVKDRPFPRSANVGIGMEQAFGEFLLPLLLSNTRDLEPRLQVTNLDTDEPDPPRSAFHDTYHKRLGAREMAEYSTREVLSVGSCFHKWTYETLWTQMEATLPVWVHPISKMPMQAMDPGSGRTLPALADPNAPKELHPMDPLSGRPFEVQTFASVKWALEREGPTFAVRPVEAMLFPKGTTTVDPSTWDWVIDTFEVSPWWFLGKEGDPWKGKLQNLPQLWKTIGIDPTRLADKPHEFSKISVPLAEFHGPFAVTASGRPTRIMLLFMPRTPILLGWRVSPFPRAPYFNRQVWHRGDFPIGKGIPETVWGLRDAMDASVNMDLDSDSLWNHPPVLMSDLAMLPDEEYELTGPGSRWIMRDINGAKMMAASPSTRNPIERENWLMGMGQRLWGVTDLNLNAPTSALSPNIGTLGAVREVLNQGNIKFSHLTRRLAEADSLEYQFVSDLFGRMLANPITVPVNGQSMTVTPAQREEFFKSSYRVSAIGNGITTNPILRQQIMGKAIGETAQNPIVMADPELQLEMLQDYFQALGLRYKIKTPAQLQMAQAVLQLLDTPAGQQLIPAAVQQAAQAHQAMMAAQSGGPGPGPGPGMTNGSRLHAMA